MNYCENLKMVNGSFYCIINKNELECKCKNYKRLHSKKWDK